MTPSWLVGKGMLLVGGQLDGAGTLVVTYVPFRWGSTNGPISHPERVDYDGRPQGFPPYGFSMRAVQYETCEGVHPIQSMRVPIGVVRRAPSIGRGRFV